MDISGFIDIAMHVLTGTSKQTNNIYVLATVNLACRCMKGYPATGRMMT